MQSTSLRYCSRLRFAFTGVTQSFAAAGPLAASRVQTVMVRTDCDCAAFLSQGEIVVRTMRTTSVDCSASLLFFTLDEEGFVWTRTWLSLPSVLHVKPQAAYCVR